MTAHGVGPVASDAHTEQGTPNAASSLQVRSVARVMGLESEYGISVPGDAAANPMIASGLVVRSYAQNVAPALGGRVVQWDYAGESPLVDARGWSLQRTHADASMLTDEVETDVRIANVVTPNGARFYVDPREVLTWDRAGDELAARAAAALTSGHLDAASRTGEAVVLYKNNVDGKGASYGTHENYLVSRSVPFERLVEGLLPFFAVRQVITGGGRVGLGQKSERPGYQIGVRSDYMEALVGLETTFMRPMVNTRDEPHADARRFRRLHVIIGDANLAEVAGLLKVGTTSLVLGLVEAGRVPAGLSLSDPLAELRAVSRDLSLRHRLTLADGRRLTAVQLLREYLDAAASWATGTDPHGQHTDEVLTLWDEVLADLEDGPEAVADRLDWAAKLMLLERYRSRDNLGWDHPKLRAIDIQWSDLRPGKGLARALEAAGRLRRLTTDAEVEAASISPPASTRAWLRGMTASRVTETLAASWETALFDLPGRPRLVCPDPRDGTREQVGDLFAGEAPLAAERLLEKLHERLDVPGGNASP